METEINYETPDGWLIRGVLCRPDSESGRLPGVVLVHGAGHDRDAFASFVYPGLAQLLVDRGVAALCIDWRGRGLSMGRGEYHDFSAEERSRIHLDVRGALDFLAGEPDIDSRRLGVCAEEIGAEWAATGIHGDPGVRALALLSGRLSVEARNRLSPELPILTVVSKEDRRGFADMSAVHAASTHPDSDFLLYQDLGIGTTMFTLWRYRYPDHKAIEFLARTQGVDTEKIGLVARDPGEERPIEERIAEWLAGRLSSGWSLSEIEFKTRDDWVIRGNLTLPDTAGDTGAPGIVFVHSGLGDRYSFHGLERRFAAAGVAVLNIDWRGRGKSRDRGSFLKLSREERDAAHLDVAAAIETLGKQPEVDATRLAVLGAYIGAKHGMTAALRAPGIKAFVMLSGYIPGANEREEIAKAEFPILFIGSRGFGAVTGAMIDLHEITRGRGSELLLYEGGALGYQLLEVDPSLEWRLVDWVKAALRAG